MNNTAASILIHTLWCSNTFISLWSEIRSGMARFYDIHLLSFSKYCWDISKLVMLIYTHHQCMYMSVSNCHNNLFELPVIVFKLISLPFLLHNTWKKTTIYAGADRQTLNDRWMITLTYVSVKARTKGLLGYRNQKALFTCFLRFLL